MTHAADALIDTVLRGGPDAGRAFDELALLGDRAVPALVAGLQAGRAHAVLAAALGALEVPDRIATLAPLAAHGDRNVRDAAVLALGRSGDPRAVEVLGDVLSRGDHLLAGLAALGLLGAPASRAIIRATVERRCGDASDRAVLAEVSARAVEDLDPSDLFAIATGAEALSRLGDDALVGAAIELARFAPSVDSGFYEGGAVRLLAVRALDAAAAPGVARALHAAAADDDAEVAAAALRATLHLGRTAAAPIWLSALRSERNAVAYAAEYCFAQLTGEKPPASASDAIAWWARLEGRFDPGVCYRLGQPATPGALVPAAIGGDSAEARIELGHAGALAFLHPELGDTTPRERAQIDAWWSANASRFPPGKLHRWGRTYEPGAVDG
jgi:HEAT repeat protein